MGRQKHVDALLIELKLLGANVYIPVNDLHEVALEVVDVSEGDATHLCDVAVRIVGVVEHL